ncbi:Ubiquitin carboxyl-terminal hydrolase 12, partial [Sesamum angolense]
LLWKVLYNTYLKGTRRTTLNASMLITSLVDWSHSMIFSLMSRVVMMSMLRLISMLQLNIWMGEKYHAGQYGLQDAKKGALFIDFPPVLQLHLKRFEYDFVQDGMVKINDRYEFPLQLDLDRDNGRYLSPEADRRVRNLYILHSVLVHNGGVHGGHYYAFIRPTLSNQCYRLVVVDHSYTAENVEKICSDQLPVWFPITRPEIPRNALLHQVCLKNSICLQITESITCRSLIANSIKKIILNGFRYKFDDERVTKEDMTKALNELYGGEETNPGINNAPFKFTRHSNAYMLVYIRESDKDKILCDIDERDISEHIKVVTDEDFAEQIGKDICFDLVDHAKVKSFRVHKLKSFHTFKEEIASEFRAPVYFQRFWLWAKRQNQTHRPSRTLTLLEESYTVGHLNKLSTKGQNDELTLFLEVERLQDLQAGPLPRKESDDILLFFKLYEPEKGELRYAGRLFVKSNCKPADILEKLNEFAGYAPDEEIELFEEITFEPWLRVSTSTRDFPLDLTS